VTLPSIAWSEHKSFPGWAPEFLGVAVLPVYVGRKALNWSAPSTGGTQ
jgi:hypothetical protein